MVSFALFFLLDYTISILDQRIAGMCGEIFPPARACAERRRRLPDIFIMKHLLNLTALLLSCLLSLFFVIPDITYVTAFLCTICLCCMDLFLTKRQVILGACLCFLTAAFICPDFLYFYPAAGYILLHRKLYAALIPGAVLALVLGLRMELSSVTAWTELCVFFLVCILERRTAECEELGMELKKIRDDSKERDLLLTEKNRVLLEKQDYEIYTATLRERNRIAREIHDNVGHLLSRSILLVGALKAVSKEEAISQPLDSLDGTLNSAMDNIRKSVHDLHDEAVNLEEAVQALLRDFTFCPVTLRCDVSRLVPRDVKYSFISITQEALSNIIRHSDATHASVTLREHPALYQLCIEDNGTRTKTEESGIGLSNMKERILALNGNIHISSDKGFKIFITVPKEKTA